MLLDAIQHPDLSMLLYYLMFYTVVAAFNLITIFFISINEHLNYLSKENGDVWQFF